ncbi:hypothetical protein C8J56DRAFT_884646 [Mycena floridula]|nr:hypothetical protein C8J56DRAFT_884646 [Mycena floridula]
MHLTRIALIISAILPLLAGAACWLRFVFTGKTAEAENNVNRHSKSSSQQNLQTQTPSWPNEHWPPQEEYPSICSKNKTRTTSLSEEQGWSLWTPSPKTQHKWCCFSHDEADELWHGTISVGTPAVEYIVDFDTGSSEMFLPGTHVCKELSQKKSPHAQAVFDFSDIEQKGRSGLREAGSFCGRKFVHGQRHGSRPSDSKKQTLLAATMYSSNFASPGFKPDRLVGMGFQSISEFAAPPLFQSLVADGATSSELFIGRGNFTKGTSLMPQSPKRDTGKSLWSVDGKSALPTMGVVT